jgi:hypothetical protein
MNSMMWIMWPADLIKSFVFIFIFAKGIQYEFWIGLHVSIGMAFGTYATSSMPFSLALQCFISGIIQLMICGAVSALIYKPDKE